MGSCACNTGGDFKGLEVRRCCSLPQSAKPSTVASFWPVACNRVGLIQSPQTSLHSRLLKQAATFSRHYAPRNVSTLAPGHLRQCERQFSQLCNDRAIIWSLRIPHCATPHWANPRWWNPKGWWFFIHQTCCRSWAKSASRLPSRMIRQEFLDLSGEQYMQYELKIWGFSEIEDIMDIMAMSCESMSLGNSKEVAPTGSPFFGQYRCP